MQCGFDVQALHSDNCVRYSGVAPSAGSDVHELDRGEADSGDVRETMHTPTPAAFAHEAGADAFMTGCVLLELASRAPQKQWVEHLQLDHPDANQGMSAAWCCLVLLLSTVVACWCFMREFAVDVLTY